MTQLGRAKYLLCGILGLMLVSSSAQAGVSPGHRLEPDVLNCCGGWVESPGGPTIFFACCEASPVGYSSSGTYQLNAGFIPKQYAVLARIIEQHDATVSAILHLHSASPNPFSGETAISYSVPRPGEMSLVIWDIQGRNVCTVADIQLEPGEYTSWWDGTNNSGARVGPGVYIAVLESHGERKTKKLVLLQ